MEERLALIEILDRDGSVHARVPVTAWPVRLGRGFDCEVVIDDPHLAAQHAVLDLDADGRLSVQALPSINGLRLGAQALAGGSTQALPIDGLLTLGATRVRVRRAGEALAPEKPLGRVRVVQWRTIGLLALLLMLVLIGEQWLDADPGQKFSDFVMPLLAVPMMVTAWSLMWGLGSKLFQRHYVFLPHLRLALLFSLVIYAAGEFLPGLAFASGWAWPSRIESLVQTALVLALVHAHLSLVLPNLRRMFAIAVGLVFAVGLSLGAFVNLQKQHRFFGELYTATLGPPALRLAPTVSVERYLEETKTLKAALDRHANDDEEDADEGLEIDDE